MRFQIPQFIEIEDKVFGPLTLKQFLYLLGGGAIIFLLNRILPFFLSVIVSIPIAALFAGLAFFKINNQPLIKIIETAFRYYTKTNTYIWRRKKKEKGNKKKTGKTTEDDSLQNMPKLSSTKLDNLAWSLDIKKHIDKE